MRLRDQWRHGKWFYLEAAGRAGGIANGLIFEGGRKMIVLAILYGMAYLLIASYYLDRDDTLLELLMWLVGSVMTPCVVYLLVWLYHTVLQASRIECSDQSMHALADDDLEHLADRVFLSISDATTKSTTPHPSLRLSVLIINATVHQIRVSEIKGYVELYDSHSEPRVRVTLAPRSLEARLVDHAHEKTVEVLFTLDERACAAFRAAAHHSHLQCASLMVVLHVPGKVGREWQVPLHEYGLAKVRGLDALASYAELRGEADALALIGGEAAADVEVSPKPK